MYFILSSEGQDAGFIQLNLHRQPDNGNFVVTRTGYGAGKRFYVLPQFDAALEAGQAADGACAENSEGTFRWPRYVMKLGVWEHNHRAKAFYEKEGFSTFGERLLHGRQENGPGPPDGQSAAGQLKQVAGSGFLSYPLRTTRLLGKILLQLAKNLVTRSAGV